MRTGLLGSIAVLAASAGLAFAQPPAPMGPPAPPAIAPLPAGAGPLPFGGPDAPPGLLNGLAGTYGEAGPAPDTEHGWVKFDSLVWFTRSMPAAFPLITTGTSLAGGVVPNIGTATVFGAQNFHFNPMIGGAWDTGYWFKKNPLWGGEWGGFVLEKHSDAFHIVAGDQVVARPFIDADTGLPNSFLVSFPGFNRGSVTAQVSSEMWGLEWNLQRKLLVDATKKLVFLVGFRYLDLHEDLAVLSDSTFLAASTFYNLTIFPGDRDIVADSFDTRNQYNVGQFGFLGEYRYRRWTIDWSTKIGLGGVYQTLDIHGSSTLLPLAGGRNEVQGGLLALDSNIGRHHGARFAFIPEGKLELAYRFCGNIDLGLGYTFMYISNVIRPSEQIDPQLSTTRIPTSANFAFPGGAFRPRVLFNESDMWVQGLNFFVKAHF